LEQFLTRMRQKTGEVVKMLMWETAKPLGECVAEFIRTAEHGDALVRLAKRRMRQPFRKLAYQGRASRIFRAPRGVVLCLGPYNFPLNETLTIVLSALLAGNTIVFKPPRFGVLLFAPLLEALKDCFPPGVVNVIFGVDEIAEPLMVSGLVDVFAFVGTGQAARRLESLHPRPHRLHSLLGLEAKNVGVVLEDADVDSAAEKCVKGCLMLNGQRCTALKLLFVHESIAEDFVQRIVELVDQLPFGMPWEDGVAITPLPERVTYLRGLVDDACRLGARIMNDAGGMTNGTFFSPAVIYPVSSKMRIFREEQFGPIIPVVPFRDTAVPIACIASSEFGQQASIFGRDPKVMGAVAGAIRNQVCRINLNTYSERGPDHWPFGARKDSGKGVRSVVETLDSFSLPLLVAAEVEHEELLGAINMPE
jgi:glyceraldehyde-3-phosphate dehydrogenase (NADP+)